jgi:hypothetical protein
MKQWGNHPGERKDMHLVWRIFKDLETISGVVDDGANEVYLRMRRVSQKQ